MEPSKERICEVKVTESHVDLRRMHITTQRMWDPECEHLGLSHRFITYYLL